MKRKTVITTETHEVWVIRQPREVLAEENREDQEFRERDESLTVLPEYTPDQDEPEKLS